MPLTTEALIQKTPNVVGGDACIRRTRIAVWMVVGYRKLGLTDDQLLEAYPGLNRADLQVAWEYYAANRDEIETALRENDEA